VLIFNILFLTADLPQLMFNYYFLSLGGDSPRERIPKIEK
jgi:hypothetical protein